MHRHPLATTVPAGAAEIYAEGRGGRSVKHGDLIEPLGIYQSGGTPKRLLRRLAGSGWYLSFDPAVIGVLVAEGATEIEVVLRSPGELDLYTTDVPTAVRCGRRHNFGQGYNDRWLVPVDCFDVRNQYGTLTQGRSRRSGDERRDADRGDMDHA